MGIVEIYSKHHGNNNALMPKANLNVTSIQDPQAFDSCYAHAIQEEGHQDPCTNMEAGNKTGGSGKVVEVNQGTLNFLHALTNCLSLLYGLGILSSSYAVAQAGWAGVGMSLAIPLVYWYMSILIYRCMKAYPHLRSYQDIAQFAFGRKGRLLITTIFYAEIFGSLVGYSISLGENLDYIFPNVNLHFLLGLTGKKLMIVISAIIILPSIWLRNLKAISFTTIWCVVSTFVFILTIFFAATINDIGFTHPLPAIKVGGVPVAVGLFAFSYGGSSVFPAVYASMKNPSSFYKVTVISFVIATISMGGLGLMGAYMFGEETASQISLSMPTHLVATKIVLWMTVTTAMTKYAIILSPVTQEMEALLPWNRKEVKSRIVSGLFQRMLEIVIRSLLLVLIVVMALTLPYFNYIVALIGSSTCVASCMIMPLLFYLKIFYRTLKLSNIIALLFLLSLGILVALAGTITSFNGLIKSKYAS